MTDIPHDIHAAGIAAEKLHIPNPAAQAPIAPQAAPSRLRQLRLPPQGKRAPFLPEHHGSMHHHLKAKP